MTWPTSWQRAPATSSVPEAARPHLPYPCYMAGSPGVTRRPEHGVGDVHGLDIRDRERLEGAFPFYHHLLGALGFRKVRREPCVRRGVVDHVRVEPGRMDLVDPDHFPV